jgi:hypothetical protein
MTTWKTAPPPAAEEGVEGATSVYYGLCLPPWIVDESVEEVVVDTPLVARSCGIRFRDKASHWVMLIPGRSSLGCHGLFVAAEADWEVSTAEAAARETYL